MNEEERKSLIEAVWPAAGHLAPGQSAQQSESLARKKLSNIIDMIEDCGFEIVRREEKRGG